MHAMTSHRAAMLSIAHLLLQGTLVAAGSWLLDFLCIQSVCLFSMLLACAEDLHALWFGRCLYMFRLLSAVVHCPAVHSHK